jgi:hypothetical protein
MCCAAAFCSVAQVLHHPWVLKTLQIPSPRSLQQVVSDYMPQARQLMAQGTPYVSKTVTTCNKVKNTAACMICWKHETAWALTSAA